VYNLPVNKKETKKTMNTKFVNVQAVFADAEKRHLTVMLDGKDYWVKRDEAYKCWNLDGRKCPWATVYDEDFEDGSFYKRFEMIEYFG
jgi:hypothetical protein